MIDKNNIGWWIINERISPRQFYLWFTHKNVTFDIGIDKIFQYILLKGSGFIVGMEVDIIC